MNKNHLPIIFLLLFIFFLVGCTEPNPISVADKTASVKAFSTQYEDVKVKSVYFDSKLIADLKTEIANNCGANSDFNEGYRVSYANRDMNAAINVWVSKDSKRVLCIYAQELSKGEKIACLSGAFNKKTNQCEGIPEISYSCSIGAFDSTFGKCIVVPDVNYFCTTGILNLSKTKCEYTPPIVGVCSQGTFNSTTQKCEIVPEQEINCSIGVYDSNLDKCLVVPIVQMVCSQGSYDSSLNKCVVSPQVQVICSQGVYNSSTQTCEYAPPVTNVCTQGTYDPNSQTCIFNPQGQTCSVQNGNICTSTQTCNENWLSATDSNKCCSVSCTNPVVSSTGNFEDSPFGFHPAIVNGSYSDAEYVGIKWPREGILTWVMVQPDISKNEYKFKHALSKTGAELNNDELFLGWDGFRLMNFENTTTITADRFVSDTKGNVTWQPISSQKASEYVRLVVERYDGDNDYGCVVSAPNCYVLGDDEYPSQATIDHFKQYPLLYWQVSNEPTLAPNLGSGFAKFMCAMYSGIKDANSNAFVINGGVPGTGTLTNYAYIETFDRYYLPIINELDGQCMDGFDFHWYGDSNGDYRLIDPKNGQNVYDHIRNKLSNAGFSSNLPIWITEMTAYSGRICLAGGKGGNTCTQLGGYHSEADQASDYTKRYIYGLSKGVKKLFPAFGFYEGFDNINGYWDHSGLIYDGVGSDDLGEGVKKLGYYSYKLMSEKLEGSDWGNIQTIAGLPTNVYAYKFVNATTGKVTYVAWWDYWNEPTATIKQVTLNVGQISGVKITQSVPHFENGLLLQNSGESYSTFFDTENKVVSNGQVSLTLGKNPVYIEEGSSGVIAQLSCGNGKCDLEETAANCSTDCYPDNLPYSVLAIHEETWGGMVKMVELANKYKTPLSIFFWPGVVDYILEDQNRINLVHAWQAQGHEIGIHNQECDTTGGNERSQYGSDDAVKYEQLVAPYKVQSGTTSCTTWLPADYKYNIGITRVEGRTSRALKQMYPNSKQILSIAGKPNYFGDYSGCGGVQLKIDQYMTLNPNEIYGYITHTLEVEGCDGVPASLGAAECPAVDASNGGHSEVPFETWLKFLYEKDPTGKRRMTLSKVMETYIIPNNLIADASVTCNSTNPLVQQCWLVGKSAKSTSSNCLFGTDTDVFNYGRCLDTQEYCDYNSQWWDNIDRYCPQGCALKNISDYNSEIIVSPQTFCGDGTCNGAETSKSCPSDCPVVTTYTCPNNDCEISLGENSKNCPADCPVAAVCPNKVCESTETYKSCSADCTLKSCGDTDCDSKVGETSTTCPYDCRVK